MTTKEYPLSPEEFKQIYSKVPRVSVDLVIQTPTGIVVTLRTLSSWNALWHFPGVTIYYQESVEDAVHRAAKQEAGITVTIKKLLGYIEYPTEMKQRGFGSTVSLVFLCELKDGELAANEEASSIQTIANIDSIPTNLVEEHRALLKNILSGREAH